MTSVSNGGTTTLGLYDTQSQLEKKADITYVDNKVDPLVGGHKGFATLALAQAAQGTLPSGSVVEVTNDATTSNNGIYLWNGTTLTKSNLDPLSQSKLYTNQKTDFWKAENIQVRQFDAFSEYSVGFVGNNNKMPLGITKDGVVVAEKMLVEDIQLDSPTIAGVNVYKLDPFTSFSFGIGNGVKFPMLVKNDGTVCFGNVEINDLKSLKSSTSKSLGVFKSVIQEWWISPIHTYLENPYPRVVSGLYSEGGEIVICEYVVGVGTTRQFIIDRTPSIDDHNAPSLWVKDGHRAVVLWTRHAQTTKIYGRVSTRDGDLRTLQYTETQEIDLGSAASYTQMYHIPHLSDADQDTFYVLSRTTPSAWTISTLSVNQDTGMITKLDQVKFISATEQYYCTSAMDGDVIRIASGFNPDAEQNFVCYIEINTITGEITDHIGNSLGNFISKMNMPLEATSLTLVLPQTEITVDRRLHYVRSGPASPAIAYAEWTVGNILDAVYKIASLESGSWVIRDVADVGSGFGSGLTESYISGISFPTPCYKDEVIVTRYDDVKDEGVLEKAILIDGEYKKSESLRSKSNHLIRPINPVNGGDICVFTEMYNYGRTSTYSFECDTKLTFLE